MEKTERPYLIAGPCSVESLGQLRQVTEALSKIPQVHLIRAGVWKPRTRPGGFEGLGEPALAWMQELSKEYGVHYCCEVARPEHVELCQQYGIEYVWLGARTTTNPFMVEEICSSLQGCDMHVMVKNPVCPDVRLWLGAIERIAAAGVADIAAIHRGFNLYDNDNYRNAPMWEVAMELRRQLPETPILCDPSHIGGRRDLIMPLAEVALQLDYDGLMIEVHPSPAEAWTDAAQQITPAELQSIASTMRERAGNTDAIQRTDIILEPLREQIDTIDHEMLRLLSRRMNLSKEIASVKREGQMAVYQSKRWEAVMQDRMQMAEVLGLDGNFTKDLLEKIHAESIRMQMET